MLTMTPKNIWFYKRDLETAASRLDTIIETMNTNGVVLLKRVRDLPDASGWVEELESLVKLAIKEIEP